MGERGWGWGWGEGSDLGKREDLCISLPVHPVGEIWA